MFFECVCVCVRVLYLTHITINSKLETNRSPR